VCSARGQGSCAADADIVCSVEDGGRRRLLESAVAGRSAALAAHDAVAVSATADGSHQQHGPELMPRKATHSGPSLLTKWLLQAASPTPSAPGKQLGCWSACDAYKLASARRPTAAPSARSEAACGVRLLWVIADQRREGIAVRLLDVGRRLEVTLS
jgi:hypothetical protein